MKRRGITSRYPKASHLTEALLFKGYRGLTADAGHDAPAVEEIPPMTPLEQRLRQVAARVLAAEHVRLEVVV